MYNMIVHPLLYIYRVPLLRDVKQKRQWTKFAFRAGLLDARTP
jgi:hypothetical protein